MIKILQQLTKWKFVKIVAINQANISSQLTQIFYWAHYVFYGITIGKTVVSISCKKDLTGSFNLKLFSNLKAFHIHCTLFVDFFMCHVSFLLSLYNYINEDHYILLCCMNTRYVNLEKIILIWMCRFEALD